MGFSFSRRASFERRIGLRSKPAISVRMLENEMIIEDL
jgi:hypothetical protein